MLSSRTLDGSTGITTAARKELPNESGETQGKETEVATLKIKVEEMKGEAILLQREPIVKVGRLHIPEGNPQQGMRVRLRVLQIGPEVKSCAVGDYVVVAPMAQFIQFNPVNADEIMIAEQKHVLARVSYEETLIEVAPAGAVPTHPAEKGKQN